MFGRKDICLALRIYVWYQFVSIDASAFPNVHVFLSFHCFLNIIYKEQFVKEFNLEHVANNSHVNEMFNSKLIKNDVYIAQNMLH